jgi:hypothetical protein
MFKKRSTVRGEIFVTMPRLTASPANSQGVQELTGRSAAAGVSQAMAMFCMYCSKVKEAGPPDKYRFFTRGRGHVPALGAFVVFDVPFPFAFSSCSQLKVWAVSGAR